MDVRVSDDKYREMLHKSNTGRIQIFYLELDWRLKVQSNMKLHAVKSNAVLRKIYFLFAQTTIVYDHDWRFDNLIVWD